MTWCLFWDMHSGGSQKEKWAKIYIEAPEEEAKVVFYNRFGHNPERVTCTCCGEDYVISEEETFEQAAGYHMGWTWDKKEKRYVETEDPKKFFGIEFMSVEEYRKQEDVCVISKEDIKDDERTGHVPPAGVCLD